jgi:hypothetical protein
MSKLVIIFCLAIQQFGDFKNLNTGDRCAALLVPSLGLITSPCLPIPIELRLDIPRVSAR